MTPFILAVRGNGCNFQIEINSRLTVVAGKSSTGKTALVECLGLPGTTIECKYHVKVVHDNNFNFTDSKDSCLILDLDNTNDLSTIKSILKLDVASRNTYVLLLGRKYLRNIPISVDEIYDFVEVQGVTKNIRTYPDNINYITDKDILSLVSEDSKSGFNFIRNCDINAWSFEGAPNFKRLNIGNCLAFIDYLGFGGYIEEFLHESKKWDNVQYIMWDSFESFVFHDVLKYTDVPDGLNLETEYESMLRKVTNGHYTKSIGCCGEICARCNNNCKHFDCKKELLQQYPKLKNKL